MSQRPTLVYANWKTDLAPNRPRTPKRASWPPNLPTLSPAVLKLLKLESLRPATASAVSLLLDELLAEALPEGSDGTTR